MYNFFLYKMESQRLNEEYKALALMSSQGVAGGGEADVSQPQSEGGEIKVEMDRAGDPLYIPKSEPWCCGQ